jgi:phage-related protein
MLVNSDYRPLFWVASSKKDLMQFPQDVCCEVGHALYLAQLGEKHFHVKPLKRFGGAGVLEIVEDDDGNTYRVIYTVKFAGALYVLHAFQKKSKSGIATPYQEIELVKARLKYAEEHYEKNKKNLR